MTIEFKRTGDVMVFKCPAFKIEVCYDSERIAVNADHQMAGNKETMHMLTDAFKVLDMMIEHKARHTHVLKADINLCDGINADIEALKRRVAYSNDLRCVAGD